MSVGNGISLLSSGTHFIHGLFYLLPVASALNELVHAERETSGLVNLVHNQNQPG
jgi:hypothetical protein